MKNNLYFLLFCLLIGGCQGCDTGEINKIPTNDTVGLTPVSPKPDEDSIKSMQQQVIDPTEGHLIIADLCDYGKQSEKYDVIVSPADRNTDSAFRSIILTMGLLPSQFELRASEVEYASAVIGKERGGQFKRYILYSQSFMDKILDTFNRNWPVTAIIAHEIGHHINDGVFNPYSGARMDTNETDSQRAQMEIIADKYSGYVLGKMRATLSQAESGINQLKGYEGGNFGYPTKQRRIAAIAEGWNKAMSEDFVHDSAYIATQKIKVMLDSFYNANETGNCTALASFFSSRVDRYFNKNDLTVEDIVIECQQFHGKFQFSEYWIDMSKFSTKQNSNGEFLVIYDIHYLTKKNNRDKLKSFWKTIKVVLSADFRIEYMCEI
jgi:hypothetical protein